MIIATRFRDLPDEQMKHIDAYVASGKPIIGMRTATHAFNIAKGKTYDRYSFDSKQEGWDGGFGRRILGETWINHHGQHGKQSTRGVIAPEMKDHPIVRGCEDIWGPTDVYAVRLPLPDDSKPLVLGQVLEGMKPTDKPVSGKQNDPMMPIAWIKTYQGDKGQDRPRLHDHDGGRDRPGERGPAPTAGQRRLLVPRHGGEDSAQGQRGYRGSIQAVAVRFRRPQEGRQAGRSEDGVTGASCDHVGHECGPSDAAAHGQTAQHARAQDGIPCHSTLVRPGIATG